MLCAALHTGGRQVGCTAQERTALTAVAATRGGINFFLPTVLCELFTSLPRYVPLLTGQEHRYHH
jgi:hypothetical protein